MLVPIINTAVMTFANLTHRMLMNETILGEPFVALLIATVAAMLILGIGHGYNTEELEKIMTKSLEPTG